MDSYGAIRLALTDRDYFTNAKQSDILVTGARPTQRVMVGTASNAVSPLQISGSNVFITNLLLSNDLVPQTDMGISLGSSNKRFKDIFLSGNSIFLGSNIITSDAQTKAITFRTPTNPAAPIVASYLQLGVGSNAVTVTPNSDGSVNFQPLDATNSNIDGGKLALTSKSGTVVLQATANSNLILLNSMTTQAISVSNVSFETSITTVNGKIGIGIVNPDDKLQVNGNVRATRLLATDGGSITVPSYSWFINPTTGMYLPDFNKLGLVTNGSNRVWIDSTGFVGINTTNPSNNLDVAGTTRTSNLTVTANTSLLTLSCSNAFVASLSNSSLIVGSAVVSNTTTTTTTTSNLSASNITIQRLASSNASVSSNLTAATLFASNAFLSNATIVQLAASNALLPVVLGSNATLSNITLSTSLTTSNTFSSNIYIGANVLSSTLGCTFAQTVTVSNNLIVAAPGNLSVTGGQATFNSNLTVNGSISTATLYGSNCFLSNITTTRNVNFPVVYANSNYLSNAWIGTLASSNNSLSNAFITSLQAPSITASNITTLTNLNTPQIVATSNTTSNLFVPVLATVVSLFSSNNTFSNLTVVNTGTISTLSATTSAITTLNTSTAAVSNLTVITSTNASNLTTNNLVVNSLAASTIPTLNTSNLTIASTTTASNLTTNNLVVQSLNASIIPVLTTSSISTSNITVPTFAGFTNAFVSTLSASNFTTSSNASVNTLFTSNASLSNITVPQNATLSGTVTASRIGFTNNNNLALGISTDTTTGIQMGITTVGSHRRMLFYTWSNPVLTCINRAQNTLGFVGINNSNPQTNLDVTGSVNVSSTMTIPYIQSTGGDINNLSYTFSGNSVGMFSPGAGQLALATLGTYSIFIDSSGYVGIGTTTTTNFAYPLNVNGAIYATDNVYLASDQRKKSNLKVIDSALQKIMSLTGYTYNLVSSANRQAGLIAQEVETVLPEVVSEDNEGFKAVAYGNMTALIVNALKELAQDVADLKADVASLKANS